MNNKILLSPLLASLPAAIGLAAIVFCLERVRLNFMSPMDRDVYKALHCPNPAAHTSEMLEVCRGLLKLPATADLYAVTKLMQERLKVAHAQKLDAVSEAHFVLQSNEKLSSDSLKNRLLLISQIMFYFDVLDPRGCSHCLGDNRQPFKLLQKI